ncbi:MAG TPA: universal stress protein [Hyphomicrobiales bacterium]|nr:universal stress protein [Hyphomicrobiales bacterium]
MPIKTILVALGLEDDGKRVADRAVQLANQHQAQLVGVHVIEHMPSIDADLPSAIDPVVLASRIKDQSAVQLQALLGRADKPAILHVETGKPHAVITALAASHQADLIVIGPGIARNLRERAFGSTADRVIRSAPCPVLVVRREVIASYGHIVVGVDFSDHAKAAAQWASRLSPLASRELIHADAIPITFEQAMVEAGLSQPEINEYRDARLDTWRRQFTAMFSEEGRLPKRVRVKIVQGDAATTLIDASRRRKTDLVALGTLGANAMTQHLLGSVARNVLAGARCDVLVVPASAAANRNTHSK